MQHRKVVFIGGTSFSGSTMLDMMLSSGEDGFSLGEVYALYNPFRAHHRDPKCVCGNDNCSLWNELKQIGEKKVYLEIFKKFPKVTHIVDSSKNPFWIDSQKKQLNANGIDVYNILIWKNPVEFAMSVYKRNSKNNWIRPWKAYHRLYFTLINNWISIPYSKLVKYPSNTVSELCDYIGSSYFKGKEYFWNFNHHTLFGNRSAKIHLQDKNSEDYKKSMEEIKSHNKNKQKNMFKYREFYYNDIKNKEFIDCVEREIRNDPKLENIIKILNITEENKKLDKKKTENLRNLTRYALVNLYLRKMIHVIKKTLHKNIFN